MGGGRDGDHSRWDTPRPGDLLQVPWESSLGSGRRLAGGGPQPSEGPVEVGAADSGAEPGGCGCPDLGPDILGGGFLQNDGSKISIHCV